MDRKISNRFGSKIIPVVAAAVTALAVLTAAVFLLFSGGYKSEQADRISGSASVVIINYRSDQSAKLQNRWLSYSLERAGMPVYEIVLDSDAGANSFSKVISSWHNWKQDRALEQGRVWLISSGIEPDLAVELSLAWEDSDLVILPDFRDLKYFSDWQDFAASLSLRWPQDKSMMIYHTNADKNKAASLYERISNEDAWLFPGQLTYPGSSVSVIRSSDGSSKLALLDSGLLDQYGWSASYIDSITAELVIESIIDGHSEQAAERINQSADALRMQWFMLPLSLILLILTALISGIAVSAVTSQRLAREQKAIQPQLSIDDLANKQEALIQEEHEQYSPDELLDRHDHSILLTLRIIMIMAFLVVIIIIFNAIRLLPLLTASWWITALVLVIIMILLIPDARLGLADNQLEKTSVVRILSGLFWLCIGAASLYLMIKSLVFAAVPYDSLIWLFSGLLLLPAARITVRRLSGAGCRIWLTLPAGAWLMLNGISIISHFTGFN